jgi:hypothetical protein
VPKVLIARLPIDAQEERAVRKLARARHAPGDWIRRAQMIAFSWDGQSTIVIAAELGCHPQTVRERLHRFNAHGLDGLGDRSGSGRHHESRPGVRPKRTRIVNLYTQPPDNATVVRADELGPVLPAHVPPCAGLVRRRASPQGAPGILPRAGESLGLRLHPSA